MWQGAQVFIPYISLDVSGDGLEHVSEMSCADFE
jgi:hypothetical protein